MSLWGAAAEEAQDMIARIYLMRHTRVPRRTIEGQRNDRWGDRDRRKVVEDTLCPAPTTSRWPQQWRFNRTPEEALERQLSNRRNRP